MSKKYEQYFSTSEFAELCGVTKYTLFHYDDLGILKPEIVNEKGYRYYSINQFFLFDIISVLKEVGTPLKEIKEYIEHQNTEQFLQMLMEKNKQLSDEQMKIISMQKLLKNTTGMIEYAMHITYGQPRIELYKAEYLKAVKLPRKSEKKRLQKISDLYKYCSRQYLMEGLPAGVIVNKNAFEEGFQGLFERADYYFCKISCKSNHELLYIKPKGKYVVIDYKGSYESISDSYKELADHITKHHLKVVGNIYESYITIGNPEKYITEIMVQVE